VIIRQATAADTAALARLRYDFRTSLSATDEGEEVFIERCRLWMQSRLAANGPWRCWVAEAEQKIVGHLWVKLIEKIPNPTTESEYHAYITNFYVIEASRAQGIGSMLLTPALDWIREQDVYAVILWPTEESRSLYQRHGFADPEDLMELLLQEKVY
jgi:GNAT superfamily N-acetyltransferase